MLENKAALWQFLIFTSEWGPSLSGVTSNKSHIWRHKRDPGAQWTASRLASPLCRWVPWTLLSWSALCFLILVPICLPVWFWFYQQTDAWGVSFDESVHRKYIYHQSFVSINLVMHLHQQDFDFINWMTPMCSISLGNRKICKSSQHSSIFLDS